MARNTNIHAYIYMYIYTHIYVARNTYMHTYIYIYIHVYMARNTYTYREAASFHSSSLTLRPSRNGNQPLSSPFCMYMHSILSADINHGILSADTDINHGILSADINHSILRIVCMYYLCSRPSRNGNHPLSSPFCMYKCAYE
jgi:hypothetical protein